jgi:hypothetical protein
MVQELELLKEIQAFTDPDFVVFLGLVDHAIQPDLPDFHFAFMQDFIFPSFVGEYSAHIYTVKNFKVKKPCLNRQGHS